MLPLSALPPLPEALPHSSNEWLRRPWDIFGTTWA